MPALWPEVVAGPDQGGASAELGAIMARIAHAVEGPQGVNPGAGSGVDRSDGVELTLLASGGVTGTPAAGLGFSVPLLSADRRRITEIRNTLIQGWAGPEIVTPPAGMALPSGVWVYVAILPNGPLGVATRGIAYIARNDEAGRWRASYQILNAGTWNDTPASATSADTNAIHGSWGAPNLAPDQTFGVSAAAMPSPSVATSTRAFTAVSLAGADPHLAFGGGFWTEPAGDQVVRFRPLSSILPTRQTLVG